MNTYERTNHIAQTHMRVQHGRHWTMVRLVLDKTLRNQVVAPNQVCNHCGKAI